MTKTLRRALLAGLLLAPFAARPASAQTPTPEGTVITNTASATWTDANGNTYTPATASVSVTVGFLPGPDVSSATSVTPASPSTGNELPFTITNRGNGVDSVSVSTTVAAGVTVTGYRLGGTTYATIGELNVALAGTALSAGGTTTVTLVYTVAPGQGGQTIPVTLTSTSRRAPAAPSGTDASTTNVLPAVAAAVVVTPDGGTVDRLPSRIASQTYSETFTVQNTGNREDTFSLSAIANPGGTVSIVSVNGTAGASGSITVAAGGTTTVEVVYTVSSSAAAGATDDLRLTATSGNDATKSDPGNRIIRVIRAAVSMTKEAFRDNQTTAVSGTVLPGEYLWYKITVTNTGGAAATLTGTGYGVTDALPSQVTYVSTADDGSAGWTISQSAGTVSAALSGTLEAGASRFFWIRVRVK